MTDHKVRLSVLGCVEDGEYCALALEMDLRGYGDTPDEALQDLEDQVLMQLSFSLHMTDSLDMALRPASPVWFSRYAEARLDALRNLSIPGDAEYYAADLPIPDAHVIESMKGGFSANHA